MAGSHGNEVFYYAFSCAFVMDIISVFILVLVGVFALDPAQIFVIDLVCLNLGSCTGLCPGSCMRLSFGSSLLLRHISNLLVLDLIFVSDLVYIFAINLARVFVWSIKLKVLKVNAELFCWYCFAQNWRSGQLHLLQIGARRQNQRNSLIYILELLNSLDDV